MDDTQGIEFHAEHPHQTDRLHDFVEGGLAGFTEAEGIVDVLGPIQGDADKEMVFCKKAAPVSIDQRPVRLDGVVDFAATGISGLQLDRLSKKIDAHQQRFSPMPAK